VSSRRTARPEEGVGKEEKLTELSVVSSFSGIHHHLKGLPPDHCIHEDVELWEKIRGERSARTKRKDELDRFEGKDSPHRDIVQDIQRRPRTTEEERRY